MAITLRDVIVYGFFVSVLIQFGKTALYLGADTYERYEVLKKERQADENFCNDVCQLHDASQRYGGNVRQCYDKCPPRKVVFHSAVRQTLSTWHLCGIETPCAQAFADFVSSLNGMLVVGFGILALPFAVFFANDFVRKRNDRHTNAKLAASLIASRSRRRPSYGSYVEEVVEDTSPQQLLLSSSTSRGTSRMRLEDRPSAFSQFVSGAFNYFVGRDKSRTRQPAQLEQPVLPLPDTELSWRSRPLYDGDGSGTHQD